jgi:hypothetical protein
MRTTPFDLESGDWVVKVMPVQSFGDKALKINTF